MADHQPEVVPAIAEDVDDPPTTRKMTLTPRTSAKNPRSQTTPQDGDEVGLSDDDVDRIARRLLELACDRIEHIAWDVIPDMAEVVVRERMRELEADAEGTLVGDPHI